VEVNVVSEFQLPIYKDENEKSPNYYEISPPDMATSSEDTPDADKKAHNSDSEEEMDLYNQYLDELETEEVKK
jgi:hypothetical protein